VTPGGPEREVSQALTPGLDLDEARPCDQVGRALDRCAAADARAGDRARYSGAPAPREPSGDQPLRVLHLLPTRGIGGPERQVLGHLQTVDRTRFDVIVYALNQGRDACALAERAAALGAGAWWRADGGPFDWASVGEVVRLIRSMGISLLCAHGDKPHFLGLITARRAGVPIVGWVRGWTGETWRVRLYDRLDRRLLRYMDAVVAVSEAGRQQALRLGVPGHRAAVVHNAVDAAGLRRETGQSVRAELGLGQREALVVSVGRLSREKAHMHLIEAARLMRDGRVDAHFVLIGDGVERHRLAAAANAAGLSERVHFMGHRAKVAALLREADAFALPSLTEGLPNAVMEAMAMGLPVVATAVGGVPELVVDGETGMLVAPASPRALAEALSELLRAAPHERQRMGEAGRERVACHFGFDAQSRRLEALYSDVVHGRRPLLAGAP